MNKFFDKLPFRKLVEAKIPSETITKYPVLGKLIVFTNQIVCVLALVLLVACFGGGGSSKGGSASKSETQNESKNDGKNEAKNDSKSDGQNAYKDFTWGMSFEQVKSICPDLKKDEREPMDLAIMDFDSVGVHLKTIHNKQVITPYEYIVKGNTYISESNELCFYFDNNKLRIINLQNTVEINRLDLEKRYGKPIEFQISLSGQRQVSEVYVNEKNRFIIAVIWYFSNTFVIDRLYYVDKSWLTDIFNSYFKNYVKEYEAKSRLD
jgi:hypothetical protein